MVLVACVVAACERERDGGADALEAFRRLAPALVILDIGMPEIDGCEVARRIRQSPDGKGTRLVALTGWGQPEDRQRIMAAGFDRHLTKPVNLSALAEALRADLQAGGTRPQA